MKVLFLHKNHDFDLKQKLPWNQKALTQDLDLNILFNAMAMEDEFLLEVAKKTIFTGLNNDLETILYRQNILKDCLKKEFTENAADELQTPLAVFQSKLDMLLQEPSLNQNQAAILQSLYEAASRLSRLNKNLLLLAKIENNQYTIWEEVEVTGLLNDVLPYFEEQALSRNLTFHTDTIATPIVVYACNPLFEIMISNLILNAIAHNHINGSICIKISMQEFVISNTGEHQKLYEENLFKRFIKTSRSVSSNGLGLSIIKQI